MPIYGDDAPFTQTAESNASCTTSYQPPAFSLAELTGDGVPDLVVTDICNDATLGESVWGVHPGRCDL